MTFDHILLYCRPGFEKECGAEMLGVCQTMETQAYIKTSDLSGYVLLVSQCGTDISHLTIEFNYQELIFTRQWFATSSIISDLPEDDRITPLIKHISGFGIRFRKLESGYADTNEGKSLQKFCKSFNTHLEKALKKNSLLKDDSPFQLNLFYLDSRNVYVGISEQQNASPYPMGIPRLKQFREAPSRSNLKLEEAIHWFLTKEDQEKLFLAGKRAVDLGASPGGWSWQMVKRGLLVTAIDNGPMDENLMATGMVEHYKTDAFTYLPEGSVDWLVCDMVEQPHRVTDLIIQWFIKRKCKHAIFNLKLPMKKRLQTVRDCINNIEKSFSNKGIKYKLLARHLYHDRDEITVYINTNINNST